MNNDELFELLGDMRQYLNDALGNAQILEMDEECTFDRASELREKVEAVYDLCTEIYDELGA